MTQESPRIPADLAGRCAALFGTGGTEAANIALLSSLAVIFGGLAGREEALAAYPDLGFLFNRFLERLHEGDREGVEDGLTMIYAYLHGADSGYLPDERKELDSLGGYWCHAGGLSPLWRAAPWIRRSTRSADYGAGNGLQGLLFQALYPHRRTTLIELSGPMVRKGRRLRELMGVPAGSVHWIHASVTEVPPEEFDFIYLYRPLRPEGEEGRNFYEWFARRLVGVGHEVTIFSIADCLKDFLAPPFTPFYDDGQLTCFTNNPEKQGQTPNKI
jgi:hypothetical protein